MQTQDQTASPWRGSSGLGDPREATPSAGGAYDLRRRAIGTPSLRQVNHAEDRTLRNLARLNADEDLQRMACALFARWRARINGEGAS
ncbi:MAG: hypothetical protein MUC68_02985 [Burkholderiaceae bacterium]|jgi:hypothetical protein|nr:hypothetical protein [Burkholderiaceae bacterium]